MSCSCSSNQDVIIFPCSGGSNAGEIADRAARQMTRSKDGKIYCLAGIGGKVSGILQTTKAAEKILVIDGCPLDCARKTLIEADIHNFKHLRLTDAGIVKGKTPVDDQILDVITAKARELAESFKTA